MMKRYLLLCSLIYSVVLPLNVHPDLIESFKIINKSKIEVKANGPFSQLFLKEDFFAEYNTGIDLTTLDESIVTIPFILNVIPIVWFSNKTYSIDVMDRDLYCSLQKIKRVFRMFYPHHSWKGDLIPQQLVTNTIGLSKRSDQPGVALFFSGGLDSVDTSMSHADIKQLLITVWGADVKVGAKKQWGRVLEQCQNFAQTYGHDHTFIKSNFREFTEKPYLYNKFSRWWVRVSNVLSLVGLTAPLLVQHNISMLCIAGTFTAQYPYPLGSHPAIDNNISFAGASVHSTGLDRDRAQKIMNINAICKEKNLQLPKLRSCWSDPLGKNCVKCERCLSTCTDIIAAGQEPREYGFNIDTKNVIQKVRRMFWRKKEYFSPGKIRFWQASLSHLNGLLEHKSYATLPKNDIEKLRNFLRSVNFGRYESSRNRIYSPQELELFGTLWEQNIKEDSEIKLVVR